MAENEMQFSSIEEQIKWRRLHIGRRTGIDVLAGKTIRKDANGKDIFADYFTDTEDEETTFENTPPIKKNSDTGKRSSAKTKHILTPVNRKFSLRKTPSQIKASSNVNKNEESVICNTPKNTTSFSVSRCLLALSDVEEDADKDELSAAMDKIDESVYEPEVTEDVNNDVENDMNNVKNSCDEETKEENIEDDVNKEETPIISDEDKTVSKKRKSISSSDNSPSPNKVSKRTQDNVNPRSPQKINTENVSPTKSKLINARKSTCVAPKTKAPEPEICLSDSDAEDNFNITDFSHKVTKPSPQKAKTNTKSKEKVKETIKGIEKPQGMDGQNDKVATKKSGFKKATKSTSKSSLNALISKQKKQPIYVDEKDEAAAEVGVRRSKRTRLPPLAFWKQERPIYEKSNNGNVIVGVLSPISKATSFKGEPKPSRRKVKNKKETNNRKESPSVDNDKFNLNEYHGTKIMNQYTGEEELEVCIGDVNPSSYGPSGEESTASDPLTVTKIFTNHMFTSGCMTLSSLSEKPMSRNYEYIILYSIVKGKLEVQIHETCYTLRTGNVFVIPKGNSYSIKNLLKTKALIHYTCVIGSDYSIEESE